MGISMAFGDQVSPDGRFRIEFDWVQKRPHHWLRSPRIIDVDRGEVLLDLWGTHWDGAAAFVAPGILLLYLQPYPGVAPPLKLRLDLRERSVIPEQAPTERVPLADFFAGLLNRN